jgi:hypothetical protein
MRRDSNHVMVTRFASGLRLQMRLPDVDHGVVKHSDAWGEDLSAGAGPDADENSAKTQTRYALLGLALRYRRLSSPWARVGDSTWGKFGGDLDLHAGR